MSGISDRNPFVGPRPIQQGEPLYGRTTEVRELFNRLQARRIVVLHSPSGAGKSSLVQAGLTPKLKDNKFDVWKPIRVNLDPSGLEGIPAGTNRYLLSVMVSLEEELPAGHRRPPAQLAGLDLLTYLENRPRRKGSVDRAVVLLFDQFEEVLTVAPHGVDEKKAFFDTVGKALDTGKFWALFIVREDFLAALAPYRERLPTQLTNTFRLDLLGLDGAREAAEQLALQGGRRFAAVEQLIRDLSTVQIQQPDGSFAAEQGLYVEPVYLQVVCRRLWEAMPKDDLTIDPEDIAKYADVSRSLSAYYAESMAKIAMGDLAVERAVREWVGSKLIIAGVRSQVRQEKGQSAGLPNALIEKLSSSYLVRTEQRAGSNWFELSHDRLVMPVQNDNQTWEEAHLHPLQVQAKLWEGGRRSQALLLGAEALAGALAWAKQNTELITPGESEFLELSRKLREEEARQRRLQRVFMVALAAVAVLAMGMGGWAWKKQREAKAETRRAQENELAAQTSEARARAAQAVAMLANQAQEQAARKEKEALMLKLEAVERLDAAQRAAAEQARTISIIESARDLLAAREGGLAAIVLGAVKEPETAGWKSLANETLSQQIPKSTLRHGKGIRHAAWSPDGRRIVTAADDGTARIWSADGRGDPLVLTGHTERINFAAWSPDGKRIVTAANDTTARIWNADGSSRAIILKGHTEPINAAAWSPDGRYVVTASWDKTARVWEAVSSGKSFILKGHTGVVCSATYSHDGQRILTASWDRTARVFNADGSGEPIALKGHELAVNFAAWSPDDKRIVTVSDDNTARIFKSDGPGEPSVLNGHTDRVNFAAWSHDGLRIVTVSADWTARVWASDGKSESSIIQGHKGAVLIAGWSANDQHIFTASEDGTAIIFEPDGLRDPIYLQGHQRAILGAAWSPNGKRMVTASSDRSARVWDVPQMKEDVVSLLLREDVKKDLTIPELQERLRHVTTDCLLPAQRLKIFSESWPEAQTRYAECERSHARTRSDRDLDGVSDGDDRCPDAPVGPHPDLDRPGCSADTDGDDVLDSVDQCPTVPAGPHPSRKRPGCPDKDTDGDGVYDSVDPCPTVPTGEHRDPKHPGCPDKDTDGDGIYDSEDKCPTVPEGLHPAAMRLGCPEKDTDGDGIYDNTDQCPDVPIGPVPDKVHPGCPDKDTAGILERNDPCPTEPSRRARDGCPPPRGRIILRRGKLEILDKVAFFPNKEVLLPSSLLILEAVARTLKFEPNVFILIEGHTADTGDLAHDMWLSSRRARSVLRYLLDQGIAPERLKARGYGPKRPIDSNRTPEGQAHNSRVEFVVTQR